MGKLTDEQKLSIVKEYLDGTTQYQLSKKYGVVQNSIQSILKVRNVPKRDNRKYQFNTNYFDEINTEEKAYWLGFIYAEGNLHNNTLAIKLHKDDEAHLILFKESIGSQHPIRPIAKKDAVVFKISWCGWSATLKKVGVVPNKHEKIKFPNIAECFQTHFIRGFFDGDGWITCHQPKDMIRLAWNIGFCSCSRDFISVLKNKIDLGGSITEKRYKTKQGISKSAFQLQYGGNKKVGNILDRLYQDATIYLKRKHDLYHSFCEAASAPKGKRRIASKRDNFGRFCKELK